MSDVDNTATMALGGLGFIADKVYGALSGKPTTAATDAVFKYLADPVNRTAAANAPIAGEGIDQRVVGDLPGILSVIGQAAATGGEAPAEEAALKLPAYTEKTADIIRKAFQTGLKGMSAPAIESAVNTTNANVQKGVDINTAVQQGLSSFVENEMMGIIPLTAGGNIAKRMATGALSLPVFTELGRRITNAIYGGQYASMQGKYDPKDTVVSAIEGAGFGTMPHPAEQPLDLRSPELPAAQKDEPTGTEPPAPDVGQDTTLQSVPNSAFNGDLAHSLETIFWSDAHDGPVSLQNRGFSPSEITALKNAGLADADGLMTDQQFGKWQNERSKRLGLRQAQPAQPTPTPIDLTPEQARLIGIEHAKSDPWGVAEQQPFEAPKTADEAAEQLHQPVTVTENAAPAENVTLQGTPDEKLLDELHEHAQQPTTQGIDVQHLPVTNIELADKFQPPEEPTTAGIKATEVPQSTIQGEAGDGNTRDAVLDAQDEHLRQSLLKPTSQMTDAEKVAAIDTDPLTLLPNRRAFMDKEQVQPAKAYSAIDLVGFKNLNDTVGHEAGDQMLQAWGKILRRSGLDASRTGGDEFTVRGDSNEQMEQAMQALKSHAADVKMTFTGPDGKPIVKGLDFRYGIGDTARTADEAQIRNRDTGRGAPAPSPGGIERTAAAAGEQVRGDNLQAPAASIGRSTDQAQPAEDLTPPAAKGGRLSRQDETAGRKSVGEGGSHTVNSLRVALQKGLGRSTFDRLEQAGVMRLHEHSADIPYKEGDKPSSGDGLGAVQAYWDGKTMHLAADGIAPGDEVPVSVHEAIHKLQENPRVRDDLREQFKRLVRERDPAAMRAILRIPDDTPADQYHDEGIAYLGEEVAKTDAAERPKTFSAAALDLVRKYYNALRARFYASPFYRVAEKAGVKLQLSPHDVAALGRHELTRSPGSDNPFGLKPPETPSRRPGESQADYARRLLGTNKDEIKAAMDMSRHQQKVGRANFKAMLAQRARSMDVAEAAFHNASAHFDKAGDEANLQSIDQWENDRPVTDPVARQFFDQMNSAFASRIARIRELAPDAMQHLIENYFPHIWEDTGKAAKWYQSQMAKRPLEGNKSFLKQRSWGTIAEGMESGLKPVSTNPVDLALAKLGQMDKFITLHELSKDLDDRGWLKTMKAGERVPDGYAKIEDPAFQIAGGLQGYKAVPELIAKDVNRHLQPGLTQYKAFRGFRYLQNALLSARLGFSAFHAGFTTFDTAASHFGVAFQAALEGDLPTAAKMLTKTLVSPLLSPFEGRTAFNQFYGKTAADADTAAVLHALEQGGARGRMSDATAHMGAYENLGRALRQSSIKGTAMHLLPGILEGTQRWITHYLVPYQKMASRTMLMKFELDRYAGMLGKEKGDYAGIVDAMHPDALKQIAGKVVQDVDDRLGQLAYDNLFWNHIAKDVAQATIQSVGWNVGTFRTIVGGAADVRRAFDPEKLVSPLDKAGTVQDVHLRRITGRLSYLIGFHIALATIGSIANYLMTGQPPQTLKDMFYPRTGRKNPDGSDERIAFPTYFKDEYALTQHPLETAEHKLHPTWSIATELLANKDFYGTEIHNPDDPWNVQAKQIAGYLAKTPEPYALENEQRVAAAGGGTGAKIAPFFGVTPAPADIARTRFQSFVAQNGTRGFGGFTRTPEEAEASQRVHAAEDAMRTGQQPDYTGMDEHDRLRAEREGRVPKPELAFMRMGLEDKLRAWDMATPQERTQYHLKAHIFSSGIKRELESLPPNDRAAVVKQLRAMP